MNSVSEVGSGMYAENILDHFRHPHHKEKLEGADVSHEEYNPVCGDRVRVQLKLDANGIVLSAAFLGSGCAISQASASMLVEHLEGKSLAELNGLSKEKVLEWLGIPIGPVRLKCALLALDTLKSGLIVFEKSRVKGELK